MDIAGIAVSEADGQVFLRGQPDAGRPEIDAVALHAWLGVQGYGACALDDAAIANAVNECNTRPSPFVVLVGHKRDAQLEVVIAPDDMSATLRATPPQGGRTATVEDALAALAQAGVVFGIDHDSLLQVCVPDNTAAVTVAYGQAPQNGKDACFTELTPQTANRAPKVDDQGLIDYREHGGVAVVEPGALLMRRTPPTPGIAGQTVSGRLLEPRPGRDVPFAAGLGGASMAESDPNLLQAAITGQPVLVPCGVSVEPVLRVAEVSLASGNIYFDGTVQIDGEVAHGMKIQASGDIVVKGTVDGGQLQAGGNIEVSGGVIGQSRCQAGGSVSARFAENSTLHAGTVIALSDQALGCDLQALNQILVGTKAPQRGRLVGGSAKAMMLLRVPQLGSSNGAVTRVMVGTNPELDQKYQALQLRITQEKTNEDNLEKLVKHLTATGDPKGMLERAKGAWRQAIQVWGKSLAEQSELEKELALTQDARVEVSAGTSGLVELAFGKHRFNLPKSFDAGSFSTDSDAKLWFTDRSGEPVAVF